MSFSVASDVITQTGTDANLSGLDGLAGVTVIDCGAYKIYNAGVNRLLVNGSLKVNVIDAGVKEQLLIGTGSQDVIDIEVTATGSLEVGYNADSGDGVYVSAQHTASIVEKDVDLDFNDSRGKSDSWGGSTRPFILIRSGGTFIWNGTICFCGGMAFDGAENFGATNTTIKLNSAVWDARTVNENGNFDQIIYSYTEDIEVKGLTVLALSNRTKAIIFTQLATPNYPVKGYQGVFTDAAFSGSTTTPLNFTMTIEDYAGIIGNNDAVDMQVQGRTDTSAGDVTFLNSIKGSSLAISNFETNTLEKIQCTQSVKGVYKDAVGANVNNFIVGTIDVNKLLYSALGDAGVFDIDADILLASWAGGTGIAPMVKTNYSPSGSDDDLYDFYTYAYGFLPRSRMQVVLRVVGGLELEFIGAEDLSITESDRAITDAYTVFDSLNKIYDKAMSWKINTANILYPVIDQLLIEAKGNQLNFNIPTVILDSDYANITYGNPETALSIGQTTSARATGLSVPDATRTQNLIIAVDFTTDSVTPPDGCLIELGGYKTGAAGTPFILGTYSLDTQANAEADFIFTDPVGTGLQTAGTARRWCHETDDTASTGVGPTSGQGGSPEGYVYTEASSPGTFDDEFFIELDHTMNCLNVTTTVTFYTNQRGDSNNATCTLQYREDGGSWTDIAEYGGADDPNKVSTSDPDIWAARSEVIPSNSTSVRIRWKITFPASGTAWHCDYGLDTIRVNAVAESTEQHECLFMGFKDNEFIFSAGDGSTGDADKRAEIKLASSAWLGLTGTLIGIVDFDNHKIQGYWIDKSDGIALMALMGENTSVTAFDQWATDALGGLGSVDGDTAITGVGSFNGETAMEVRLYYNQVAISQSSSGDPAFDVNQATNILNIDTNGQLIAPTKFSRLDAPNIILRNDAALGNYTVVTKLTLENDADQSDLTVEGVLDFTIAGTYTFTNCVINEVTNSSDGNIILNLNNSTVEINTGANITINNTVTVKVKVTDIAGTPIENARVRLMTNVTGGAPPPPSVPVIQGLTNVDGIIENKSWNYEHDLPVIGWARKSSGHSYYKQGSINATITSQGLDYSIGLVSDE